MQQPQSTEPHDERPSKTQRKKQAHELQDLGAALLALPDDRLAALPMPEALLEALREARRIRSPEGRRRQLQYVGKLMRQADTDPLRAAVAHGSSGSARETLALHEAERWRDELVRDGGAIERWLASHPQSDAQRLRSLVRAARADAEERRAAPSSSPPSGGGLRSRSPGGTATPPERRHGRAWRELFQFVKQALNTDE